LLVRRKGRQGSLAQSPRHGRRPARLLTGELRPVREGSSPDGGDAPATAGARTLGGYGVTVTGLR